MKKWTALGLLAALLLVGCGGINANLNPMQQMLQAEDGLKAAALSLADEAEGLFAEVLPTTLQGLAPQTEDTRALTLVQDGDGITILVSLKRVGVPSQPSSLPGSPLGLTIKCASSPPRFCGGRAKKISLDGETQGYRVVWYGEGRGGSRQSESVPLTLTTAETSGSATARQRWSYNKIGLGGFWADALIQWPGIEAHLQFPLPSIPGQTLVGSLDPTPFEEALRRACCGLPKPFEPFEVDWPPAILLREDIVLAFLPYRNPRLREALSVEGLLNQPLGIAYLRVASEGKLTRADAARLVEIKLVREEPDYYLVVTDLKDPTRTRRVSVGEVGWCDGCFGQDPPPRYLGIEDRLTDEPLLHLQVGNLLLRGIEKKDIRRSMR
ncbi:hypothetical protein [Meiothermus cerbereus]|uniref:hypothetical protein n=1 Tax=Meiothermus cerbereus TaxID=65552 RepID=UPI003EEC4A80